LQKKHWLQIICYKFSSIPLLGKKLASLRQFPSLPFHYAEFILRKLFEAGKYEPNKETNKDKYEPSYQPGSFS
jgi:hypothetical protein